MGKGIAMDRKSTTELWRYCWMIDRARAADRDAVRAGAAGCDAKTESEADAK